MKVEIKSIKKTQTKENMEIKSLGMQTGTTVGNLFNRLEGMEERISGTKDTIEKNDFSVGKKC